MIHITIKRSLLCSALISSAVFTQTISAANWIMLQGTEPGSAAKRAKMWGFVQAQYQYDNSDPVVKAGDDLYNPPKLIGPNLDDQSQFNVNRARVGIRGANLPIDDKTNYFILLEAGNNGITHGGGSFVHVTDASITLNHIPHARFRLGLFKTPGVEEGLNAVHIAADYVNFTSVTNQLMLERFPDKSEANKSPSTTPDADLNQASNPVGAFRDLGVQVFDAFKINDWELTYAFMIGNGNGLSLGDNDKHKNYYGYLSSEKIFKGKKARRQGWKSFLWYQEGKRTNVFNTAQTTTRKRYGIGTKYLSKPIRVTAEYMQGRGMIFQGPHRPKHLFNDLDASGWYIEGGFYIPKTKFEIDLRFDSYTREENHPTSAKNDESTFDTWTLGMQYHFNKKTRIGIEYAKRSFESDTKAVDKHLKDVDGRFAIQVTAIY